MNQTRTVLIPPGAFIMGTDIEPFYGTALAQSAHAKLDEAPMHVRFLAAYRIAQYPVTNAEYATFVKATSHPPPAHWKNGVHAPDAANLPVVQVSWHDCNTYAQWTGKRLPTEAEWEKACRGPDGRVYPWGNAFAESEVLSQILKAHLTPVGSRHAAASPYGVHEAAGNVWEWTADWYEPYAGTKAAAVPKHKTLRGGSWLEVRDGTAKRYFRCANRLHAPPDYTAGNIGFRCVKPLPPEEHYAVHVPIETLTDYVKQHKLGNLTLIQKRALRNSIKDSVIAMCLIGGGTSAYVVRPDFVLGGVTVGIIGLGFLFSAGVNFWRRWRAGQRINQVDSEDFLFDKNVNSG